MANLSRELAAPLTIDASGGFAYMTSAQDKAAAHVRMILETELGERLMVPDYGTRTLEHLFSGITDENIADIRSDLADSLGSWGDDITVITIDVTESENVVTATVVYTVNQSPDSTQTVSVSLPVQAG